MSKRPVQKFDFKPYGAAIKSARMDRKESREKMCDEMYISGPVDKVATPSYIW